jgi:hypothetical protein
MKIGQDVWEIAKFRSRKPFVFMVAIVDVFDKVLLVDDAPGLGNKNDACC